MALLPYLLSDALGDLAVRRAACSSIFDQNFGLGVLNDDLVHPHLMTVPLLSGYLRPWRHQATRSSGISNILNNQEGFKVNLDVQQFKPEEINVKMIDNFVVVEGNHEEREDEHGFISRKFLRKYKLPDDVDPDAVISKLSSDGVLSIEGAKKVQSLPAKERVIHITQTNAPAVKVQQNSAQSGKGDSAEKTE